jgi:C-terminal processing protease CtpA/Prc
MNNLQLHNAQTKNNQRLRAKLLPKKHLFRRIHLHRPVGILNQYDDTYLRVNSYYRQQTHLHISTGLTFDDGDQLLVSAQKPLGIVLEEREEGEKRGCVVVEVVKDGNAGKAGVKVGDLLVAVQNADVGNATFDDVMSKIGNAPRVVNLRFWRRER